MMQSEKKRKNIEHDSADTPSKLIKLDQATTDIPPVPKLPTVVHLRRLKGKVIHSRL